MARGTLHANSCQDAAKEMKSNYFESLFLKGLNNEK
jgi:hypothetical protein